MRLVREIMQAGVPLGIADVKLMFVTLADGWCPTLFAHNSVAHNKAFERQTIARSGEILCITSLCGVGSQLLMDVEPTLCSHCPRFHAPTPGSCIATFNRCFAARCASSEHSSANVIAVPWWPTCCGTTRSH